MKPIKPSNIVTGTTICVGLLALTANTSYGASNGSDGAAGAVYVSTNQLSGNEVAVFRRAANGGLTLQQTIATGGWGAQTLMESQDAVVLNDDHSLLFTVNTASDDVSVFRVDPGTYELTLVQRVPSGGDRPLSLDVHEDLLYVLNTGITAGISGFRIANTGELTPIPGSIQPLSSDIVLPCTNIAPFFEPGATCNIANPAEVEFSPDGRVLVVSERLANQFSTYTVDENGVAGNRTSQTSSGETPFGMNFGARGRLLVAEAFLDRPGQGAASSYNLTADGVTEIITGSLPTNQASGCWMEITPDGRYAYQTNPVDSSITGFRILDDGELRLINGQDLLAQSNDPRDEDLSVDGRYLYVLNNEAGSVNGYQVNRDGTLNQITTTGQGALPIFGVGLAAF